MPRACAIDLAVAFLTGNHVVQIGFDQISPSPRLSARSVNEIKWDCTEEVLQELIQQDESDVEEYVYVWILLADGKLKGFL